MKKRYKGIIFDMDGLLFDTESLYCQANIKIAPKYGIKGYDEALYMRYVGISDAEVQQAYYKEFSDQSKETIDAFMEEGYREVKKMFLAGQAELKPGVRELLIFLKGQEIPCIVASSNLRVLIDILLKEADIRDYFIDIVSSEDVKFAKPDPEIVEKAALKLGLAVADCLMLEDSFNGVIASYKAGVDVIMVPDLLEPTATILEQTLLVLPSLHEVKNFLTN